MSDKRRLKKKFLLVAAAVLVGLLLSLFIIGGFVLEPLLKRKLHTLIVTGSDSLYQYSFGSLHVDLFGANVAMKDLKVWVDSGRYRQMRLQNKLPSVTIGVDMKNAQLKGISLLALLAGKKLKIQQIISEKGQLTMARHYAKRGAAVREEQPFWKAIKPAFEGISIGQINLAGMQFFYWDLGPKDVQLAFQHLDAEMQDVKIDSAMLADTTRLGYLRHLSFRLENLAFLSADSVYRLNAGRIQYSSDNKELAIADFHLRPSREYAELLRLDTFGKTYFTLQTETIRLQNMRLEQFISQNTLRADSLVLQNPVVAVYFDRSAPKDMRSKVGNFPHQLMAKAPMTLAIAHLFVPGLQLTYTEKSDRTEKEGIVTLNKVNLQGTNLTNDPALVRANPVCTLTGSGNIMGGSPIATRFKLYLDSSNGRFDAEGRFGSLMAPQLSPLAENLAGMRINHLNIDEVLFSIEANDSGSKGTVRMRYNGLDVQVLKTDPQTGDTEIRRFLSSLVNKYMVHPSNPAPDGSERVEENVRVSRLLSYSFFGLIWKTIFFGMQNILLKTG